MLYYGVNLNMKILDVSDKQIVKNAQQWRAEINQLYHPTGELNQDSFDIVYTYKNLNPTKFVPILLKEWFYLVKQGGYLVIDYSQNELCDEKILEEYMWWLWKKQYEIVYHGGISSSDVTYLTAKKIEKFITDAPLKQTKQNKTIRFICKKITSTKVAHDDIDSWTFGIITNGKRLDWIERIIQSIKDQKISHYEIIICGKYYKRKEKNILYIPFTQRDDKGWITK